MSLEIKLLGTLAAGWGQPALPAEGLDNTPLTPTPGPGAAAGPSLHFFRKLLVLSPCSPRPRPGKG